LAERLPLVPDESASVVAGGQLEAAVLARGVVDADHRGDEQVRVDAPARLLVLVGLEAVAPRQLEVDLVLEEHRGLAEQRGGGPAELVALAQGREAGVERAEVLDALEHALARLQQARLEVHHAVAGHHHEAVPLEHPCGRLCRRRSRPARRLTHRSRWSHCKWPASCYTTVSDATKFVPSRVPESHASLASREV